MFNDYQKAKLKEMGFNEIGFIEMLERSAFRIETSAQKKGTNRKNLRKLKPKVEQTLELYNEFKSEINSMNKELIASLEEIIKVVNAFCTILENIGPEDLEKNTQHLSYLRNKWEFSRVWSNSVEKEKSWLNFLTIVLFNISSDEEYECCKSNKNADKFWQIYKGKII